MSASDYMLATAAFTNLSDSELQYIDDAEIRLISMGMFEAMDSNVDGERDSERWGVYCNSIVVDPDENGQVHYRRAPKNSPTRGCGNERYNVDRREIKFIKRLENCPNGRPQFILSNYEI